MIIAGVFNTPFSGMEVVERKPARTRSRATQSTTEINSLFSEHSAERQLSAHSLQADTGRPLRQAGL